MPAAPQTITFNALSPVTYGGGTFSLGATASSGLTVTYASSNSTVATVSGSTVTIVGTGSTNITASQAGNGSYNAATDVIQALTVNVKPLTVTSPAVTPKTYDGTTAAAITGSITGQLVGADVVTLGGTGVFADVNVNTGIAVTPTYTLSGANAAKYSITQPTGMTGDITKANQTITFNTAIPSKLTTDVPFAVTATATSGLSVSFESSNTAVATVSGSTVTIVGAGTATISAVQAGNGNYNAAPAGQNQALSVNYPAPVATAASHLTGVSMYANWGTVAGATGYVLDVYTKTGGGSTTILSENFDGFTLGAVGGGANSADVSTTLDTKTQTTGWTGSKIYDAAGTIKMGVSATLGYIVTPTIDLSSNSGAFNISFKSMAWSGDSTKLKIYLDNTLVKTVSGLNNDASYTLSSFSVDLTGGTASSKIKFEGNQAGKGRFFLEDLVITSGSPAVTTPIAGSPFSVSGGSSVDYYLSGLALGTYYYTVKATDGTNTSAASNEISGKLDILTNVNTPTSSAKIIASKGQLTVSGVSEYTVYNAQGVEVANVKAANDYSSVALRSGIYFVKVAGKTQKVMIK